MVNLVFLGPVNGSNNKKLSEELSPEVPFGFGEEGTVTAVVENLKLMQ